MMQDETRVSLRRTEPGDLDALFTYQADDEAAHMAAFVNESYKDKAAYLAKWNKLLADHNVNINTILLGNKVIGSISTWWLMDELQISYGIARDYWNRGIVTEALKLFLPMVPQRPLYGRVAYDNIGSAKVLMNCGFKKINEDQHYAHTRGKEITELIFLLED